jgi:uridine kinase
MSADDKSGSTASPTSSGAITPDKLMESLVDNPVLALLDPMEQGRLLDHLRIDWVPAGTTLVHEGEAEETMYFLLDGTARITKGNIDLGNLPHGAHFGELGLITQKPRAASIVAESDLSVAILDRDAYERMAQTQTSLALSFLQAMVGGLGQRLSDMTENVGTLLKGRSLPRRSSVRVLVGGEEKVVTTGTRLDEILPRRINGLPVVGALMDRRPVSLSTAVAADVKVEPLTTVHSEGERIYRRTLGLLLLEAAHRVDADLDISIGPTVARGLRIHVHSPVEDLVILAHKLEREMHGLANGGAILDEEWWTVDEAVTHFAERGDSGAVELLSTWRNDAVPLASFGNVFVLRMNPFCGSVQNFMGFAVMPSDDELFLQIETQTGPSNAGGPNEEDRTIPGHAQVAVLETKEGSHTDPKSAVSMFRRVAGLAEEQHRWLSTLGISGVGAFNRACIRGDVSQMIRVSEGFQEKRIGKMADAIRDRSDRVRIVCIAGPSSSGKTTFIQRLKIQLQVNGMQPRGISLDNYYVNRAENPKGPDGDYDYEALEALRLGLFQDHLKEILDGKMVKTAAYDFEKGLSSENGGPDVQLAPNEILMLEGIHGLNPALVGQVNPESIFRIYVSPQTQLPFDKLSRVHASDVRLLRRIIRDRHSRGTVASDNILRWPKVRSGERKHIFPYQEYADAVFDSSLVYELSVLKVFAERYLLEVPHAHPAYATAFRLLNLVSNFVAIYPNHVPPTSILREFIGGSGFESH